MEAAHDHKDLDQSLAKEDHPLYLWRDKLEQIMFELDSILFRLANNNLVQNYEKAYTRSEGSKYYGKTFVKVTDGDAARMLGNHQAVTDQIVREIE